MEKARGQPSKTLIWNCGLPMNLAYELRWVTLITELLNPPISKRETNTSICAYHSCFSARSTKHFGNGKALCKEELLILQSLSSTSNRLHPQLYTDPSITSIWPKTCTCIHPSPYPISSLFLWSWNCMIFSKRITLKRSPKCDQFSAGHPIYTTFSFPQWKEI